MTTKVLITFLDGPTADATADVLAARTRHGREVKRETDSIWIKMEFEFDEKRRAQKFALRVLKANIPHLEAKVVETNPVSWVLH